MASIAGSPPSNNTEKRVFDSLARQLDDSWLLASNVAYVRKGSNAEGELDLFIAHETYGIFVIEVKGGRLERDSSRGWLHWNNESNSMQPTNAFQQVQSAKRSLVDYLKGKGLTKGFLPVTPFVVFADVKRPNSPLGADAEPLLIFGGEIDSLLEKIQLDHEGSSNKHFSLQKLSQILFPTVKTLPYSPPVPGTLNLNALEEQLAEINNKIKLMSGASTTDQLVSEVSLLRDAVAGIQESSPLNNSTNEFEVTEIVQGLEQLQRQMTQVLENQRTSGPDSMSSPLEVKQLRNEILAMRDVLEEFATRVDEERQDQIEKVEVDLTSVEELLADLKKMVSRSISPSESAKTQEVLAPVLSSLGILSARMAQVSQAVNQGAIPLSRFDAKLDRLADMYREVSDRVEQFGIDRTSNPKFADEIRREMKIMQERLTDLSNGTIGVAQQLGFDRRKIPRSRLSPALVAVVVITSLMVGSVAIAELSRGGNESQPTEVAGMGVPTSETASVLTSIDPPVTSTSVLPSTSSTLQSVTSLPSTTATRAPIVITTPSTQVVRKVPPITITSPTTSPSQLPTPVKVSTVELGEEHSCVLSVEGSVLCWGSNSTGQLGSAKVNDTFSAAPIKVDFEGRRVTALSAGRFHTCAITTENIAYCWGSNSVGQLGVGSTRSGITVPTRVAGDLRFSTVSAGGRSTCGVTTDGRGFCWGRNADNELGKDVGYSSVSPVEVAGGWRFKIIDVGEASLVCGIEVGGRLLCWGDGDDQFGPIERNLYSLRFGESLMAVGSDHVCLLQGKVDLRCISWYSNDVPGVGDSRETMGRSSGVMPEPFVAVSLGFRQTCGLTSDGRAYCWGAQPTLVNTNHRFVSLVVRGSRQCGVTATNSLYCWGTNADGVSQSGVFTTGPTLVPLTTYG